MVVVAGQALTEVDIQSSVIFLDETCLTGSVTLAQVAVDVRVLVLVVSTVVVFLVLEAVHLPVSVDSHLPVSVTGQTVVLTAMVSVTTLVERAGQSVTVAAQLVIV